MEAALARGLPAPGARLRRARASRPGAFTPRARPVELGRVPADAAPRAPPRRRRAARRHRARPLRPGAELRLRPGAARGAAWPSSRSRACGRSSTACPGRPPSLARRAAKEAVHEIGHTFGLVHCPDRRCPMSLSIDLADLDGKTAEPCAGLLGAPRRELVRCDAPARRRKEGAHEGPLAHPRRRRRGGDDRVARRLAARGRLLRRHRLLRARGDREGRARASTPSTSSTSRCPAASTASRP